MSGPESAVSKALAAMKTQMDPTYFLLSADEGNTVSMYGLQASTAGAAQVNAELGASVVTAGDAVLKADSVAVQKAASGTPIQAASNLYAYDSTKITNTNDGYNTISQTGSTAVSDLTRQEANAMESSGAVLENMGGITSLLSGWSN